MSSLRYRVLGPVDVRDGEDPVHLPAGRRRAVLARLLIARGRPVGPDALIDAAWPEGLPRDPHGALHTVLSRLRSTLGEESIATVTGGYALHAEPGSVDADRFEQLREKARSAAPSEAADMLRTALALWRGPAYADLADHDAAVGEASRLDRLRRDTVEDRAAALIACAEHSQAVEELEAMLREDPFRERAVELLMTALYGSGRAADALACFRAHRDRLAAELGLDPAPSLIGLQDRILGHEMTVPAPDGAEPTTPTWVDTSTSFVGRERELAELSRILRRSRLTTVTGMGGVGKTRLVAEALPELSRRHGPVIVVELATAAPGQVASRVSRVLGANGGSSSLVEDVVEFLSIARLLLVLDNCEHLLAEVAALAEAVGRRCPQVHLLATSRHRLGVTAEHVLLLEPFDEHDPDPAVQLFVDRLAQVRPEVRPEAAVVRRLCGRLDGLPLAIELAASRAAGLGVEEVEALLADGSLPPGLEAVVDWSVGLLTPSQRRLLALVSVVAGPLDREAVEALVARAGLSAGVPDVAADLAELVEAHLLVPRNLDAGAPEYGMTAIVRARSESLLDTSGAGPAARASHARWVADLLWCGARQWVEGGTVIAGRRLRARVQDVTAALRWALAAGRLDEAADVAVAYALHLHWVTDETLSDLVIAVGEACAEHPAAPRAPAEAAGALACAVRGLSEPAQRLGRCALEREPTVHGRVLAGAAMAISAMYAGHLEDAARWSRTVIEDPEVVAGHRADLRVTLSLAAGYAGDRPTARTAADLALLGAQAAGAEAAYAFALYADGELLATTAPAQAAARFRDAARRADRIAAPQIRQVSRLALFGVLVRQCQDEEALALATPLLEDLRRSGAWPQMWTMMRLLAELLMARGSPAEAALLLGAADVAEGAPPLIAADLERGVDHQLQTELGEDVLRGIGRVAAGLSRTQVVDRAAGLLLEQSGRRPRPR